MRNLTTFKRYFRFLIDLKSTQEHEDVTINEVNEGIQFRGKNLWLLAFAIIISCIGLNINSKSAVIGAMIISPVMGPVFGIGFSLATSNIKMLQLSFKNAFLIIFVSLFFSTLYYLVNPIALPTDELLSFAKPTIFDVILAFIGGLAGMLAISRESGTQVIIGIAVATACIPPLCTAGFGLATLDLKYCIGGLYTYFINSLFICIGCYIMTKFLKFSVFDEKKIKNINAWFVILIIITIVPAIYLAYDLVKTTLYINKVNNFITTEINPKYHVINTLIDSEKELLEVDIMVQQFDEKLEKELLVKLASTGLKGTNIKVHQTIEDKQNIQSEIQRLKTELELLKKQLKER